MFTSLLLVSMAHAAPVLDVHATNPGARCPGNYTGVVSRATPGGIVAIVSGVAGGRTQIPAGMTCAGTVLSVGSAVLRMSELTDPATGSVTVQRDVPAPYCGAAVQVVDTRTCTVSNVEIVQ